MLVATCNPNDVTNSGHQVNGALSLHEFIEAIQRGNFLKHVLIDDTAITPFITPEGYDWTLSTAENYNDPQLQQLVVAGTAGGDTFVGEYRDIRKTLDYSYHSVYPPERQLWQDDVIRSVVVKTKAQSQPWVVYTAGPMGAGKGYALSWM